MPMKTVRKLLLMIDVMVDDDLADIVLPDTVLGRDGERGDQVFVPPKGITAAVQTACAVAGFAPSAELTVCIRFSTDETIQALNRQWRDIDAVTDVLSFPMQVPPFDLTESLGDIALAVPFVRQESNRLGLPMDAHALHLIVHSTLHLLGFDHIGDDDTVRMQSLEIQAMHRMRLHHPYPLEDIRNKIKNEPQSVTDGEPS